MSWIVRLQPKRILDLGIGFGKYGMLLREPCDIWHGRYFPPNYSEYGEPIAKSARWSTRIVGVELCRWYNIGHQGFFYDAIHWGVDIRNTASYLVEPFDVVLCNDVIEHLDKAEGEALLVKLFAHAQQGIFITPPPADEHALEQGPVTYGPYTNEDETHRSVWDQDDFDRLFPGRCEHWRCGHFVRSKLDA